MKVDEYKEKVSRIVSKLGVPVQVIEHPPFYILLPLACGVPGVATHNSSQYMYIYFKVDMNLWNK